MCRLQSSKHQATGVIGFKRLNGCKKRELDMEKQPVTEPEGDTARLIALPKTTPFSQRRGHDMFFRPGARIRRRVRLVRDGTRQQATTAAIAAYQDAMRRDDPRQEACRAALRAYLEICPNEDDLSDRVAEAIVLAIVDPTSRA